MAPPEHGRDDQPVAVYVCSRTQAIETKPRKLKIKDAMKLLVEEELLNWSTRKS